MMNPRTKWLIPLLFGITLILVTSCTPTPSCVPVYAVTKTTDTNDGVCSPGDCSLREAVLNANACPGSHTINLPAGGYTLTRAGADENLGQTGDLDVTDDLVIIGTGAPSINGNIERSIYVHSGVTATFDGIWLTDGSAIYGGGLVNEGTLTLSNFTCNYNNVAIPPGGMGDAMGGCIFNTGDLSIQGGHFLANTAGFGGAIYNYDNAVLTIEDSSFTGNQAEFHGGALWNGINSTLEINNSSLSQNQAGWNGGGIWNHGSTDGSNLLVENNQAVGNGGGIYNWEGSAIFTNAWLTLNTADAGGGLFNEAGMVHFYESGLTANTTTGGGGAGIINVGPPATTGLLLKNVTISNNIAPAGFGGAGIYSTGNFDFRFVTIAENSPEGLRISGGSEIKIRSSILADNPGGNCAGIAPDSLDYNIVSDGSCALIGSHDLLGIDPLLESLAPHGGMAPSHALGVGSPAIDSGVPDLCIEYDQNGTPRPQGPWCDRGAHENLSTKAIIRGWTYIDDNDNSVRDPGEGYVTGSMLTLKEGACPGSTDLVTVESGDLGFYEILDIDPGVYCLASSPIQQTADPVSHDLTLIAGDVLEEINFRYMVAPGPDSSISGKVWHDLCAVPDETPPSPPAGCISLPGGGLGADGIYDPSEPGIEGVYVNIGMGSCPITSLLTTTLTDVNGDYSFPVLFGGGPYCVSVDALTSPNDSILIPGNWTYPVRDASPAEMVAPLGDDEDITGINFGWDYQFLPLAEGPASNFCELKQNAFLRTGPSSSDYPTITAFLKGHLFEVLAVSGPDRPGFYFGQDEAGFDGWIAQYLLDCKDLDITKLEIRKSPPVPIKTPTPIICSTDLSKDLCEAAGGTMSTTAVRAPYCVCP